LPEFQKHRPERGVHSLSRGDAPIKELEDLIERPKEDQKGHENVGPVEGQLLLLQVREIYNMVQELRKKIDELKASGPEELERLRRSIRKIYNTLDELRAKYDRIINDLRAIDQELKIVKAAVGVR